MHLFAYLSILAALALMSAMPAHADEWPATYVETYYKSGADYQPAPMVRVAPAYPLEAAEKRLEGNVVLEFTVATSGSVKDLVVVRSTDPVFEAPARGAVWQWKYAPQIKDGKAYEFKGMHVMLAFRLAEKE